jgi:hypothetical protein
LGANLHLIWAGCHSYCQGTCFCAYTQNLTKISTHSAPLLQNKQTNKQTVFHNIRGTFGGVCWTLLKIALLISTP